MICVSRLLLDTVLSELLSSFEFAGGEKMEELSSIKIFFSLIQTDVIVGK